MLPAYSLFIAGMNLVLLVRRRLLLPARLGVHVAHLLAAGHGEPSRARHGRGRLCLPRHGRHRRHRAAAGLRRAGGRRRRLQLRRHPRAGRSQAATAAAILLVLLGAGSKAGLVPFHAWLPLAHPAAPSHVSALMSGAMTKVALYAILRVLFDLTIAGWRPGKDAGWWPGLILIALGSASTFMGALYALWQGDLKKLLAYSTVENIGIVALGLGLSLVFRATGLSWACRLGAGRRPSPCPQPRLAQGAAVLRRRRGDHRHGRARSRAAGRADPSPARHRRLLPDRCRRPLGPAAPQRLRLGMAHLPGDPGRHQAAALGAEIRRGRGGRGPGPGRRTRRHGLRARLRHRLPRPAAQPRRGRGAGGRAADAPCPLYPVRALRPAGGPAAGSDPSHRSGLPAPASASRWR